MLAKLYDCCVLFPLTLSHRIERQASFALQKRKNSEDQENIDVESDNSNANNT